MNIILYLYFPLLRTAANAVTFQAYLLEGLTRWNAELAASAVQEHESSNMLYAFDMSLKCHLNRLHMSLRNEAFLPNFTLPGVFTGEHIGAEYLWSQSDVLPNKALEKEIDEAFEDYQSEVESVEEHQQIQDLTLALPEDYSDSNSGTKVSTAEKQKVTNQRKTQQNNTQKNWNDKQMKRNLQFQSFFPRIMRIRL